MTLIIIFLFFYFLGFVVFGVFDAKSSQKLSTSKALEYAIKLFIEFHLSIIEKLFKKNNKNNKE